MHEAKHMIRNFAEKHPHADSAKLQDLLDQVQEDLETTDDLELSLERLLDNLEDYADELTINEAR